MGSVSDMGDFSFSSILGRGTSDSVDGYQQKWYDRAMRQYYKCDRPGGREGLVEVIMSAVLDRVSLSGTPVPHVHYWLEDMSGIPVTVSKSFLARGEREVSFADWIEAVPELRGIVQSDMSNVSSILYQIVMRISRRTKLPNLSSHYGAIMLLDYLFLNEDRHWSNVSVIKQVDGKYRIAPIFDNGRALVGMKLSDVNSSYQHYEPRPYNADQLECLPDLLNGLELIIDSSSINFDSLRDEFVRFYADVVVDIEIQKVKAALGACSSLSISRYVKVV